MKGETSVLDYNCRYKEKSPIDTIHKIKSILTSLNINTIESWMNTIEGIYTVRVVIEGTHIGANGKGSNEDFALASGYAELLERLQNMLHFRLCDCFSLYTQGNNYEISPDEVYTNGIDEDIRQLSWLKKIFTTDSIKILSDMYSKCFDRKVTNIMFKSLTSNEEILIPLKLIDLYYGSNGMAAGNTFDEAMVQGISEIIERYVANRVISEQLCTPDITTLIKKAHPQIDKLMKVIEDQSYKLLIKDFSLGEGYPVIGVVLIDKERMSYLVNLGSHPSIEIACERSITELLQGRDLKNMYGMIPINADFSQVNEFKNRFKIFLDGGGIYPSSIFIDKNQKDYEITSRIWNTQFNGNRDMLNNLVKFIEQKGLQIYYRDVSFLGFNTYQVIIPGMSELTKNGEFGEFMGLQRSQTIKRIYSNIHNASFEELKVFTEYLDDESISSGKTLGDIFMLPLKEGNILNNLTKDLLLMMTYAAMGDNRNAYKYSIRFIDFMESQETELDTINYYKVISQILNLKSLGLDDNSISMTIQVFVDTPVIEECLKGLMKENIFAYLPQITCPDCNACSLQGECYFKNEKRVYKLLIQMQNSYYDSK